MSPPDLKSSDLYLNRELSWLEFNDRVLQEGLSDTVPVLERLKFLAIVSSNLDEFFMIRVAGLLHQRASGVRRRDPSGLTAGQQLERIGRRVRQMVTDQTTGVVKALGQLREHRLTILDASEWTPAQRAFLRDHFATDILPVLSPLAVQELQPPPLLKSLQLHLAVALPTLGEPAWRAVVIPLPTTASRFLAVPADTGVQLVRLEDVIAAGLDLLFPGAPIHGKALFRITRDADIDVQDDMGSDLLQVVESAVLARRRRAAVRLEVPADADTRLKRWLTDWVELKEESVYEAGPMLDLTALFEIANHAGFDALRYPDWPPQVPRDLVGSDDLWETLQARDVLLFHPYEQFDPVVQLLQQAAEDPNVLAIKQTLYRTSGDSPIVRALEKAAQNGKQVTVLVELKARFDEARNVVWARRLEDAGCHVIYGIAGVKTHAKALLIVRREANRIRRYVHLATGNYNDRTARLYSDVGLLTADRDLTADAAAFFNLLTGASEATGWSAIAIAPTDMRRRLTDLIEREMQVSSPDHPGLIMAKINSLQDPDICQALYRASRAGVTIRLNVRGICVLRPGVPKISDRIEVHSIVDRYLEHARIFYFANGGHEEVFLSSADWMTRNLDRRLEMLFPVTAPALVRRLSGILETCFADNVQARRLLPDGSYVRVDRQEPPVRAQQTFYQAAVDAARTGRASATRFRPLTRPAE